MCVYICYWYVCVDVCASHSGPTARQVCVCVCIYVTGMCVWMCVLVIVDQQTGVCVFVCLYVHMCVFVYNVCVHVCVCMSLNIAWNAMETHQSMNNCDSNTRALRAHDIIQ